MGDAMAMRNDDVGRASSEIAARLEARGIALDGHEHPDELVRLEDALERFERAVESRGGDLMVDEGTRGRVSQPDDPRFALPQRLKREAIEAYLERLERATDAARHPKKK